MKQLTIFALAVFFTSLTATGQKSVPDVVVKTLKGQNINLQEYTSDPDKIYIISFWATWCAACKKELDAIADYYEEWQEEYNVELLAITIDNQRALPKVPGMVESKGWEYTIFAGNEQTMQNAFNFQPIPQTVVAKGGVILYEHNGYVPGDEDDLEEVLKEAGEN